MTTIRTVTTAATATVFVTTTATMTTPTTMPTTATITAINQQPLAAIFVWYSSSEAAYREINEHTHNHTDSTFPSPLHPTAEKYSKNNYKCREKNSFFLLFLFFRFFSLSAPPFNLIFGIIHRLRKEKKNDNILNVLQLIINIHFSSELLHIL